MTRFRDLVRWSVESRRHLVLCGVVLLVGAAVAAGAMRISLLKQSPGEAYISTSQNLETGHSIFGSIWSVFQGKVEAAEPLSAYVPQGSLMAVESPDFAGALAGWTKSDEERAWVKSDDYAEFSRSRLFSRLGEAQSEFAASAGLAPDANFLSQVAGKESLFAWYDIGKLEFLYVTRMKPGDAANNPLMKLANKFQMRKAGADSFYVRAEPVAAGEGNQDSGQEVQSGAAGGARRVAFAVQGDLLLLATREDLIANALLLAQHQGEATLRNEPWYLTAVGAAGGNKDAAVADLRMTLNLARIVPSPYFRSYWVQKNVSEMKNFGAAVVDLYRSAETFREERILIPKQPDKSMMGGDLGQVLRYLPADSGVYRATAMPGTAEIVNQLDQRLISRRSAAYRDLHVAPVADLSEVSAGSSADLDMRIDEQPVPEASKASSLAALRELFDAVRPDAMLVYSNVDGNGASHDIDAVFFPIHSAAIFLASASWDARSVQAAFTEALGARLTVGGVGLSWQTQQQGSEDWIQVSGLQPLALAIRGQVLIVASDSSTLLQLLRSSKTGTRSGKEYANVRTVAGFGHTAERKNLLRLSELLDGPHAAPGDQGTSSVKISPAFFSGNMTSISQTFNRLDSETFVERPLGDNAVQQVVIYRWRP